MTEMKMVQSADYLIGHVDGEQYLITNTTEQICAFLMKYRWEKIMITDIFNCTLLRWDLGFIEYCQNQQYLGSTLIPVLAPLQMGETEHAEFVPYTEEGEQIIENVRFSSPKGWYLGKLYSKDGESEPYSRMTMYYDSEDEVKKDYPNSISFAEAIEKLEIE